MTFFVPQVGPKLKAVSLICFLLVGVACSSFTVAYIHDKIPQSPPLPDVWFALVQEHRELMTITEFCITASFSICLVVMLTSSQRWLIMSRFCYISGLLYFGRAVTMGVTLLPTPSTSYRCDKRLNNTNWNIIAYRAFGNIISLGSETSGFRIACGDWIYSGHTLAVVISALFVQEYSPKSLSPWLPAITKILSYLAMLGIVTTRLHYTLDVILAYFLTTRVFWSYHEAVGQRYFPDPEPRGDLITEIFWYPMLRYVEG